MFMCGHVYDVALCGNTIGNVALTGCPKAAMSIGCWSLTGWPKAEDLRQLCPTRGAVKFRFLL